MSLFNQVNTVEDEILLFSEIYWKKYSEHLLDDIGELPPINMVWKKSGTAGFAYYKGKIEFNVPYFLSNTNQSELEELIAHELAHIIQFRIYPKAKQGHGPEFRYIMNCIGFSGRTYHSMSVSSAKSVVSNKSAILAEVEI